MPTTHSPGKSHSYPWSSFLECLLNRFHEQNSTGINNNHKEDRNKNSNDDIILTATTTSSTSTTGSTSNAPLRMSILGPSQSAKTSLAMDFAYYIAASTSADQGGGRGIVLFVIPECKRSLLDFPMHCHNVVANDVVTSHQSSWNQSHQQGLENIQIKYMASVTDLVYFLASCLGSRSSTSTGRKTTTSSSCQQQGSNTDRSSDDDHVMMEEDSDSDGDCNNSPEDEYKGDMHCQLDAIVIDDLDYYIQPQQPQQQEHDDDMIHDGATNHHDGESVAATATAGADASNTASSSMTNSLEVQKLIQLLALIADTANWMDETMQRRKSSTPSNHSPQSSRSRDYDGVHILTCINTHRLPLGSSSLSQINKGIMSMMQNYTPTIVCIEQMTRLMECHGQAMERDNDKTTTTRTTTTTTAAAVTPTTIYLDTFFHLKRHSTSFVSKGDKMVKLLSSWKVKLYHQDQGQMERNFMDNNGKRHSEYKETFESKFCVAMRCWYNAGMEKNLFSYMDESSVSCISRNDEEEDEEHELYWAL